MTQVKLKTGNYSDIKLISLLKNDMYVEKIYGKKTIIGAKSMPILFDYFLKYKKMANAIDLPICETSYEKIIYGSKNSYIVECQSYIKTNFEDYIKTSQDAQKLTLYIEQYLRIFGKIWKANFPIGVDPSIRNFGIDNDGDLKYFDFFPPHQKTGEKSYFIWPEPSVSDVPFFIKRYFTYSQVQVIYAHLLRHLVNHKLIKPRKIMELIRVILGNVASEHLKISEENKKRILSKPDPHDMDVIRLLACELAFEKKITHNQLNMIFKNTHISNQHILVSQQNLLLIIKTINKVYIS